MSKNLPTVITAAILLAILVIYMITYQVGFTDRVVVTTFGKPYERSDVVIEQVGADRAGAQRVLAEAGIDDDQIVMPAGVELGELLHRHVLL